MPLPGNFQTVTITGAYVDLSGAAVTGAVTFTMEDPVVALADPASNVIVITKPIVANLSGSGTFSAVIPATNDPDLSPAFNYRVVENFPTLGFTRNYLITVPFDTPGGTLDLADIAPVTAVDVIDNRFVVASGDTMTGTLTVPTLSVSGSIIGAVASSIYLPASSADSGWLAWAYDPAIINAGSAVTSGTIYVLKHALKESKSVAKVVVHVTGAMSGATASQNWAALLDSSGVVLGTVAADSVWTSSGVKVMTLSGGPFAVPIGNCYVALLANASTPPSFGRGGTSDATLYNGTGAGATYRFATNGTGQTTITNRTLSSSTASSTTYWSALDD